MRQIPGWILLTGSAPNAVSILGNVPSYIMGLWKSFQYFLCNSTDKPTNTKNNLLNGDKYCNISKLGIFQS